MPALTSQERRDLALTIAGEIDPRQTPYGTPESQREIAAILGTIHNRGALAPQRYGNLSDVVRAPKQYSTWNDAHGRRVASSNYGKYKEEIDRVIDMYERGYVKSPVPAATHYWAPAAMAALTGNPNPYWAGDIVAQTPVGAHVFGFTPGTPERLAKAEEFAVNPPVPTAKPPNVSGLAGDYGYYAATRLSAPPSPIDRPVGPVENYNRAASAMLSEGIRGVGGQSPATYAAPFGTVERAPLPSIQDIARTKGYQQYGASRAAALQPTLPDTIAAPPTLTRSEDYFGPPAAIPRSRQVTPADMPYSVSPRAAPAIDPVTVRATAAGAPSVGVRGTVVTSPMAGFDETVPATPTMGFPEAPKTPGRQAREAAAKGALVGALTGGPFGAVVGAALGPARNQIIGNIRSNMQGMGRVPVFSGIKDAYRGMFNFGGRGFGGMFSGIPAPNYSASPFSVGSGYGAIDSVFGGPAGATAYSRSDPSISFTSLGNGYVSRHNADFNTTQTMAPGSYDAGMFSGPSKSSSSKK